MSSPHADLHQALANARQHSYTTTGEAWRQIIASLVFETKCDLSLIQEFDEQDQARFLSIITGFMNKDITLDEIRNAYLEFFQHPEDWQAEGWENWAKPVKTPKPKIF
jgi:hypothetical protein